MFGNKSESALKNTQIDKPFNFLKQKVIYFWIYSEAAIYQFKAKRPLLLSRPPLKPCLRRREKIFDFQLDQDKHLIRGK